MKFKKKAKIETDGFWMALDEGYINFEDVLEDSEEIKKLNDAVDLLRQFQAEAEKKKVLKYY
jgi:hypothetical protein